MTRAQGKHREFSLNQSVATLYFHYVCDGTSCVWIHLKNLHADFNQNMRW